MTRTGQAAIDYARGRVGTTMPEGSGYCLKFVRDCFAVPSYYASAIDAWNGARWPHPGDRNPPPAVPLFFRTPSQYDHVVFGCSAHEIVTTFNDQIRSYVGPDAIDQVCRDFDGTYLGWSEDLNTVRVHEPATEPEAPDVDLNNPADVQAMKMLVAETLRENIGDGASMGAPPSWWTTSQDLNMANTLRANLDDTLPSAAGGWAQASLTRYATRGADAALSTATSSSHWTPRLVVYVLLALAVLALVIAAPFTLDVPEAARPYVGVLAAMAGSLVTLVATTARSHGDA